MKQILLLLGAVSSLLANFSIRFDGALNYTFDSNIGQHTMENSGRYVTPKVGVEFRDIGSIPLYVNTDFVYQAHVVERSPKLNSPFFTGGIGYRYRSKSFWYTPELNYLIYVANNVYESSDTSFTDKKSFVVMKRSWRLNNDFRFHLKNRNHILIHTRFAINDFGDIETITGTESNPEDGWRITLEPAFQHDWKVRKKDRVAIKEITSTFGYELNSAHASVESYQRLSVAAEAKAKLWYPFVSLELELARKLFGAEVKHPHTGEMITPTNKYFYVTPELTIPLPVNFSLDFLGRFRMKSSNHPSYDYDRHTFGIQLNWDGSIRK